MGRLMGLDLGEKRIGVAVTDDEQHMAFPERVLTRRSAKADRQVLARLAGELGVEGVVIGLPISMDGVAGANCAGVKRFGEFLARVLPLPVEYQDERLSTVEADERLRAAGLSADERRTRIDSAAAAVILEDYLRARQR